MKPIRMVAVDMDGTLLGSDQKLPEENARALREAEAAGIAVVICTGRMIEDGSQFARAAGLRCWIAGCNGARLLSAPLPEGRIIARHDLPAGETTQRVIDVLMAHNLIVNGFQDGRLFTVRPPQDEGWQEQWSHQLARRGIVRIDYGEAALRLAAQEGLIKLVAIEERRPERLVEAGAQVARLAGVDVTSSWTNNIEIMPAGIDKGSALREISAYLGLSADEVMAIGDQENDRPMLDFAGHSTAMGNATDKIKAICVHRTLTNDEAGVAYAVRRWALGAGA